MTQDSRTLPPETDHSAHRLDPVRRRLASSLHLSGLGILYTGDAFTDGGGSIAAPAVVLRHAVDGIGGDPVLSIR